MLTNRLKKIKSVHDLRTEKIRLRYEYMRAEESLNDSLYAIENLFTVFSMVRKAGSRLQSAYNIFTTVSGFLNRFFGKKRKKEHHADESPPEQ